MRRLLHRWLTRRARTPRWVRMTLALALGGLWLISIAAPGSSPASEGGPPTTLANAPRKSPEPQPPGAPTSDFPASPRLVAQGIVAV